MAALDFEDRRFRCVSHAFRGVLHLLGVLLTSRQPRVEGLEGGAGALPKYCGDRGLGAEIEIEIGALATRLRHPCFFLLFKGVSRPFRAVSGRF